MKAVSKINRKNIAFFSYTDCTFFICMVNCISYKGIKHFFPTFTLDFWP